MSTAAVKPFLIAKDPDGRVRLTVRETRYNSQGYPWVLQKPVEQTFATTAAARAYAADHLGAKAGEFSAR
jgi:hypothetical protein